MVNFPNLEQEILEQWEVRNIFKKSLAKNPSDKPFVFFEGPPTANAKPATHHVLARAFKDLIPRYKTMQGFRVDRKAGWDTQGLPVELQVEKELGFKGKPDIEKYGIAEFNAKCREDVWKYKEEWEKLTRRMGFWLDMEHPYVTYENYYLESLWFIFKKIHEAGLLYQGYKVLPHCPRCATALSSHEVALGYKNVKDNAVYVKFKLKPGQKFGSAEGYETKDSAHILSWTTTPWTLPGNVALAIAKNIKYSGIRVDGVPELLILAEELVDKVFAGRNIEHVHTFKGSELVGLQYEPLFDIPALQNENSHKVYAADFVTTTDGTGVVHTAVMYGEEDFDLGIAIGLPQHHTVDEGGNFTSDVPEFAGMPVKHKDPPTEAKTTNAILAYLEQHGQLFKQEMYEHDYPFCWRCATPLLYYAKPSWFIKMSQLKDELKAANEKINWYPEHIKHGRFGEWLEGVKDWAISRERYWGTPLPIWQCGNVACKHVVVIESLAELAKKIGKPIPANQDMHRPYIDQYTWKCLACQEGLMKRVPEVADCWFDSGSMPFAQWGYPHREGSEAELKAHYPADYISEAIDQTRGWFYTLLAVSTVLKKAGVVNEVPPYKNVICLGHINDKHGQKMSKSKGNIVDPWEVINKFGVDALRFHFYTANQPGEPKNFDVADVDGVVKRTFLILANVVSFYQLYAPGIKSSATVPQVSHVMDKWILALLAQLTREVTEHLDRYEITEAGRKLASFITDLSTWYVRRSRDRFKDGGEEQAQAVRTLGYVLVTLAKLMAPFTPFVAEYVYREVSGEKESVHLEDWPLKQTADADASGQAIEVLLSDMTKLRQIVEMALAKRAEAKVKVRQPLRGLRVQGAGLSEELKTILADEVNVLSVQAQAEGELAVELDTAMDDELKVMGLVREFTRQVNGLRKEQGLTINDRVVLKVAADEQFAKILEANRELILKATLSRELVISIGVTFVHILELEDTKVSVEIEK